jgi:RNA polymerase sigma factor (sigma-70 family)
VNDTQRDCLSESNLNQLCKKAQEGDKKAENYLFKKISVRFRSIAGYRIKDREDVEEVCQEALKTIIEKYRHMNFDGGFTAWAYKVLDNKVRKRFELKGRKRKRETAMEHSDRNPVWKAGEVRADLKQKLMKCLKLLNRTNKRYARVIVLQFQGYKVDEICEQLTITRNNLYVLLSRSRSLLRRCMETGKL